MDLFNRMDRVYIHAADASNGQVPQHRRALILSRDLIAIPSIKSHELPVECLLPELLSAAKISDVTAAIRAWLIETLA